MLANRRILLGVAAVVPALASAMVPFGDGLVVPPRTPLKTAAVKTFTVPCLAVSNAPQWNVESPPAGQATGLFSLMEQEGRTVLRIAADKLEPARSTVRILLPGDGPANGDVWARNRATHIAFLCKSDKPASLTFHLLLRGKPAGSYLAPFSVEPGDWQRVVLPVAQFGLKSFAKVAGVGVRVTAPCSAGEVLISDLQVGAMPYTDDSWKTRRVSISLDGEWRFATDPGEDGMKGRWYDDRYDDAAWKVIRSGQSWQQQGIDHYGFGWYRQQLVVPKECAGLPVTLTLSPIPADDDVWVNGQRVGGFSGEYKYTPWITRSYTVPASVLRYGATNTIALRIWGGRITFIGANSGLVKGPLVAECDPYRVGMREPGGTTVPAELFDLSDARQGKPFEIVVPFPADLLDAPGGQLRYRVADGLGNAILAGRAPLAPAGEGVVQAVVPVGREAAQTVYLRGRLHISLLVENAAGTPVYSGLRNLDQLSFAKRDHTPLPELPETREDTPYGSLRLVDDVDCSVLLFDDPHPYLQGGFDHAQDRMPPGGPVEVKVVDILGRKARECGPGWFAYRVGRGKLKPHTTYLLRIEYPDDKPRFVPLEIQTGQNYMDVGWKSGVAADDVYDPWPLSHAWQTCDVVVPLDDETVGTGGTGTAPAENGFWVYFMNKVSPQRYYAMYDGGPAIGRMRLYEIDPVRDAPVIRRPAGLPQRVLSFDWERQADHAPADLVHYAKLMGYSAISPIVLKWFFANYTEPLNGYQSVVVDAHDYWATRDYVPGSGTNALPPIPGRPSQHVRYLDATREAKLDYIPRFEWGGSQDLPREAWALDVNGQPTKANRFAPWCANLLNPLTWEDLKRLMDHMIKPYVKDNPQLTGALWRLRCNRLPPSYGRADIEMFARETGTPLPPGGEAQWAAWAAGEVKAKYDDWWHAKRAQFHIRLADLLRSYRPDMTLYYYNWDVDKFSLIEPDITAWAFLAGVVKPPPDGGRAAYVKDRQARKGLTAADYISVLRSGNFGKSSGGLNRADLGIRPDLYKDAKGIQVFAPVSYLCYADKPEYLEYFRTGDGLAVSDCVSYDEIGSRSINPKYEGNMVTPGGPAFSMALELLAWFHGDARTLNYTVYTYGRGFADAHRRFAQAFLALPAIPGTVVDQGDADVKVRVYPSPNGTYVGVAYKGFVPKTITVKLPGMKAGAEVSDLVSGRRVPAAMAGGNLQMTLTADPMQLSAFLIP